MLGEYRHSNGMAHETRLVVEKLAACSIMGLGLRAEGFGFRGFRGFRGLEGLGRL